MVQFVHLSLTLSVPIVIMYNNHFLCLQLEKMKKKKRLQFNSKAALIYGTDYAGNTKRKFSLGNLDQRRRQQQQQQLLFAYCVCTYSTTYLVESSQ